jgi:HD superfamily phosphohydrolase
MKTNKRIRTVLYEDQRLSSAELEVLHTPAMQRLYGLRQLGLTDRVFIDASHARIHHVVGVLEQVDKLVSSIVNNLENSKSRTLRIGSSPADRKCFPAKELADLVDKRKPVVRLIGLLHDLTHAPFGHTVEDEIQLVKTKHDEPARQADAFYRLLCQLVSWLSLEARGPEFKKFPKCLKPFLSHAANAKLPDSADVGALGKYLLSDTSSVRPDTVWRLSRYDVAELLAQMNCAMTALLHLEALHKLNLQEKHLPMDDEYEFQSAIRLTLEGTEFEHLLKDFKFQPNRDAYMLDIVGNTVCADLLDYAKRDSHFAGLKLDYDSDRIAENFTLISLDESDYERTSERNSGNGHARLGRTLPPGLKDPFAGRCLRTAISLVSHKYRTDVPSELMNLLNVRFYLYERVIFHPTKCAAGSMLGTALQLLGWRTIGNQSSRPALPDHLRFVGDDVFIHDIRSALDFTLDLLSKVSSVELVEPDLVEQVANLDRVHSGLVPEILRLRIGQSISETRQELAAARLMLDRLTARRYFRPVFRALPGSSNKKLQADAEKLAEIFENPDTRYDAERQIEKLSGLPVGTITIHCPTRTTAKKIANVFLLKPNPDGDEDVRKLKDIQLLDGPTFGKHAVAVQAVEDMYRSMWRLMVYVAPEHLLNYENLSAVIGRVIVTKVDAIGEFGDQPELSWENDPHLMWELKNKLTPKADISAQGDIQPALGRLIGSLADDMVRSGDIPNPSKELLNSEDEVTGGLRSRLKRALLAALSPINGENVPESPIDPAQRPGDLLALLKTYARTKKREDEEFKRHYSSDLFKLSPESYSEVKGRLQIAVSQTKELELRAKLSGSKYVHSGHLFREFKELLNSELRRGGLFTSPDDDH